MANNTINIQDMILQFMQTKLPVSRVGAKNMARCCLLLAKIRSDPQFNFSIFTFQVARSTAYQDLIITSVDYHIWK